MRSTGKPPPAAPARDLGQVLNFMQLLWTVDHRLQSASKRMQARLGVTGPQRLVIRMIGHYGQVFPGTLATVLQLDPSSLTGILKRLEQAHLIQRQVDPRDARRAVLELSARGRRLDAQRAGTVEAAISKALRALPASSVRATEAALRQIATQIEQQWGAPPKRKPAQRTRAR